MFVSKLQTNIRQFFVRKYVRFCIDKRMFVYYNAVIESKQMFAAMQGGYDHERNEEEKLQKNKSKKSKTLYLPFHSLICPLPGRDHLQQADCGSDPEESPGTL